MKYQLKFIPCTIEPPLFLPLDTESKQEAEQIAFELATILGAEKEKYDPDRGAVTVYIKSDDLGVDTEGEPVYYDHYRFHVC